MRTLTLACCLAACGGSQSSEPAPAPTPTPATPAPVAAAPATSRSPCDDVVAFHQSETPEQTVATTRDAAIDLVRRYLKACGKQQIAALTTELVRFPTVYAEAPAATGQSFLAMATFLEGWASGHGLAFRKVGENDAWEIALGDGPRQVGFVMHADVVPAGEPVPGADGALGLPAGWTHPPFETHQEGDLLYGRGTEDDKGPIAAVLVLLAALSQASVDFDGQVLAILGTGEEEDWDGMERYAGSQPLPRFAISVDASFPLVVGESGFVSFWLSLPAPQPADAGTPGSKARIVALSGGEFLTQVPGEATMTLLRAAKETVEALDKRVATAVALEQKQRSAPFQLTSHLDGERVIVTSKGAAVHSSTADEGHNALWPLSGVSQRLALENNAYERMLELVARRFDGDHFCDKLGLAYSDPVMGKLLCTPTVLREKDSAVQLGINMRRPSGVTSAEFGKRLDQAFERLKRDIDPKLAELTDKRWVGEPALASLDGPLATTLIEIYRAHTGDGAAKPITIRGGTYARLFPGAVSFGPSFPGKPYRGHAPDESIDLGDLAKLQLMLLDATLKLSQEAPARTAVAGGGTR